MNKPKFYELKHVTANLKKGLKKCVYELYNEQYETFVTDSYVKNWNTKDLWTDGMKCFCFYKELIPKGQVGTDYKPLTSFILLDITKY